MVLRGALDRNVKCSAKHRACCWSSVYPLSSLCYHLYGYRANITHQLMGSSLLLMEVLPQCLSPPLNDLSEGKNFLVLCVPSTQLGL